MKSGGGGRGVAWACGQGRPGLPGGHREKVWAKPGSFRHGLGCTGAADIWRTSAKFSSRDSSAGRASDRRSEGPRFDPGSRQLLRTQWWAPAAAEGSVATARRAPRQRVHACAAGVQLRNKQCCAIPAAAMARHRCVKFHRPEARAWRGTRLHHLQQTVCRRALPHTRTHTHTHTHTYWCLALRPLHMPGQFAGVTSALRLLLAGRDSSAGRAPD